MIRIIETTLGEEILEKIGDKICIVENKTTEVYIEEIIEMIIMREVEVDLEKHNFQTILE